MPIQFVDDRARGHLLKHGQVYTFRTRKRKRVGRDWACEKRGSPKFADVRITFVREVKDALFGALKPYAKHSGFDYVADWVTAIMRLNPGDVTEGFLYLVEVIKS